MSIKKSVLAGLTMIATMFALMIGLTSPASAAPCTGGYPPATCSIQLSANVVPAGGQLSFSATGFNAGETVVATVHSKAVQVGTFTANDQGAVSGTVTIPTSIHPGRHTFVLTGQDSGVTLKARFTVAAAAAAGGLGHKPSSSSLAFTGMQVSGFVGAGILLIGGGAMLIVVSRRRRGSALA